MAHHSVLFLDELPEFNRSVLEVLRQPLEERTISIARTGVSQEFPASFMLVASMNPCPCGYYNHPQKECTCESGQVNRYLNKVSGPLLDRIDLHIQVNALPIEDMAKETEEEDSAIIRERVIKARAYDRILKISRTIADLAGSHQVQKEHLIEAIGYRTLDKSSWGKCFKQ